MFSLLIRHIRNGEDIALILELSRPLFNKDNPPNILVLIAQSYIKLI